MHKLIIYFILSILATSCMEKDAPQTKKEIRVSPKVAKYLSAGTGSTFTYANSFGDTVTVSLSEKKEMKRWVVLKGSGEDIQAQYDSYYQVLGFSPETPVHRKMMVEGSTIHLAPLHIHGTSFQVADTVALFAYENEQIGMKSESAYPSIYLSYSDSVNSQVGMLYELREYRIAPQKTILWAKDLGIVGYSYYGVAWVLVDYDLK